MNTQQLLVKCSANHENFIKKSNNNENMKKSSSMENLSKITIQQPLLPKSMRKSKSYDNELNTNKSTLPPKPIRKTKSYETDLNMEISKPMKRTNSYEENLQLKENASKKEFENDMDYYNKHIDYKKTIYETIKSQAPGLLLDIAKESQHVDTINQLKDNLGDMMVHHVADTLVTSTLTHIIHKM